MVDFALVIVCKAFVADRYVKNSERGIVQVYMEVQRQGVKRLVFSNASPSNAFYILRKT